MNHSSSGTTTSKLNGNRTHLNGSSHEYHGNGKNGKRKEKETPYLASPGSACSTPASSTSTSPNSNRRKSPLDNILNYTSTSDTEIIKMNALLSSEDYDEDEMQESDNAQEDWIPSKDDDVTVFVDEPSANLLCPIHRGLFVSPVIAKCGHTFCRTCLIRYVEAATQQINECPLDKTVLKHEDLQSLIPNLVVAESIQSLKIVCKYGCKRVKGRWIRDEKGCSEVITIGRRKEHENVCPLSTTKCPYGSNCPPIRRMHLEEHVKSCSRIPCPHKKAGCHYVGRKAEVEVHVKTCPFETIKGFISKNNKRLAKLKKKLKEKDEANKMLQHTIIQLNNRLDAMSEALDAKSAKHDAAIRQLTTSLEGTQNQLSEALQEIESLKNKLKKKGQDAPIIEQTDYVNYNCKGTFTGHSGPVWGLAVTDDGLLVSGSSDTTIKIWDVANLKCKQTLTGNEGIVHAVVVNGKKLCSGSSDKSIRVWDLETMECIRVIKIHDNTVCSLATANGLLFSGSFGEIKVWDLESYECIQTLTGHNHWVRALTAAEGRLYSGSYNIIKIWDMKSPFQCIRTITGNYGSIYALAVVPEYNYLLSGTYENKINVYDLESYKCIHSLSGHIGAIYTLAVAGNHFISGSYDSTIKVWSCENFKCVQTLVRHSSSVDALVAKDGCIFSGSADHSVKVWR